MEEECCSGEVYLHKENKNIEDAMLRHASRCHGGEDHEVHCEIEKEKEELWQNLKVIYLERSSV